MNVRLKIHTRCEGKMEIKYGSSVWPTLLSKVGSLWWSCGQRLRLLLCQSEFKSRSSLHIFLNVKYGVGLFKKLCPLLLRHCQDLFKISFTLDSKKFMSSKRRNTKSEDIFPLLHYYVYSQAMNI